MSMNYLFSSSFILFLHVSFGSTLAIYLVIYNYLKMNIVFKKNMLFPHESMYVYTISM